SDARGRPVAIYTSEAAREEQGLLGRLLGGNRTLTEPVVRDGRTLGQLTVDVHPVIERTLLERTGLTLAAAPLLAVLPGVLLAASLQRRVSDPIVRLAALVRRVSRERDFSLRAGGGSDDEIGELIAGVNEMLAEIQSRDRALRQHREQLEAQVEARTAELRAL